MNDLVLPISDLRSAIDRVLNAVERTHGEAIVIPHDHYWHLGPRSAFDMTEEPKTLTVGQVSDDLAEVQAYVAQDNDQDEVAIWHNLGHVIGLLRVLEALATP